MTVQVLYSMTYDHKLDFRQNLMSELTQNPRIQFEIAFLRKNPVYGKSIILILPFEFFRFRPNLTISSAFYSYL